MLPIIFQPRLFIALCLAFIVFTVIGTLSHEAGHYFMTKRFGAKGARIAYAYSTWGQNEEVLRYGELYKEKYADSVKGTHFDKQVELEQLERELQRQGFWRIAAGPLQTMFTGTLALFLIFFSRKKFLNIQQLRVWQWALIFFALFWLRELFNFLGLVLVLLIKGKRGFNGDEARIAKYYLDIDPWYLDGALALIATIIVAVVVFKFVPARQRFTLVIAGIIGGLAGAVLWLKLLGPRIMP